MRFGIVLLEEGQEPLQCGLSLNFLEAKKLAGKPQVVVNVGDDVAEGSVRIPLPILGMLMNNVTGAAGARASGLVMPDQSLVDPSGKKLS